MERHTFIKAFPDLYEYCGCTTLYSRNHPCKTSNEKCSDCGKRHHFSETSLDNLQELLKIDVEERAPLSAAEDLFSKSKDPRPPLRLPRKDFTITPVNGKGVIEPVNASSNRVTTAAAASPANTITIEVEITHKQTERRTVKPERPSKKMKTPSETQKNGKESIKDLKHTSKPKSSRKRGRSADVDDDVEDGSENKSLIDELKHYKSLAASLKEQNTVLLQKHDTLRTEVKELKESLSNEQKQAEKFQAKLKMYRNASLGKTLDRLKEQTERSTKRAKQMEDQRNQLYFFAKNLKSHCKKYRTRVSDLIEEYYEYVAPKLYPRYPQELIAPGTRPCISCCSPVLHHPFHCVAQGVTCHSCHRKNHLTAVCWESNELLFSTTGNENELLTSVAKDVEPHEYAKATYE